MKYKLLIGLWACILSQLSGKPILSEYGEFSVGFRQEVIVDYARPGIPFAEWSGKISHEIVPGFRKIPLSIWYPAVSSSKEVLSYGDYMAFMPEANEVKSAEEKMRIGKKRFLEYVNDIGANDRFSESDFTRIFQRPTKVKANAKSISKTFPVVIIPEIPFTNTILAERLASHGFIVVCVPMMGTDSSAPENTARGMETKAQDVQRAIAYINHTANVQQQNIGLLGTGFNASTCVLVRSQNSQVKGIVSLDGGIDTNFENTILLQEPFFDPQALSIPLLAIYTSHPSVDPAILDSYKYTTRYYRFFNGMREFDFLDYGVFNSLLPGLIGATTNTETGFNAATHEVINFFMAVLLKNDQNIEILNNPNEEFISANYRPSGKKPGLSIPPTLVQCRDWYKTNGVKRIVDNYYTLKTNDPQPYSEKLLRSLSGWLSYAAKNDFESQLAIARLRIDSYPGSSAAYYNLARIANSAGNKDLAEEAFLKTLQLIDLDKDQLLSESLKERIKAEAEKFLTQP